MALSVNALFDSGNIDVLSIDDSVIRLAIRPDASSEFLQWFHFCVAGCGGRQVQCSIDNAGATTYPDGWKDYTVATSVDRQHWFRTPAQFDGQSLSWTIDEENDLVWFAYFAPYSQDQHDDLVASVACAPGVRHETLGNTLQGRRLDYFHLGPLPGAISNTGPRAQLWSIARQHPGESMTEWWMQGWLDRLLDADDATSVALRSIADIHVVPNMNPDGSVLGHLRTNAAGVNLNRQWAEPSMQHSPEVFVVRQRMDETGVDLSLDIHGDEALPYNFIAGTEGVASWNDTRDAELKRFKHTLHVLNPDFQYQHGYPRNRPQSANMTICSNQIAERFNCLAVTLEMPFKDTADTPVPETGWSPERSMRLGASFVDVCYMSVTKQLLAV